MAGQDFVVLMITGLTSAKPSGNLRKQDLLLTSPGGSMGRQRATHKRLWMEREGRMGGAIMDIWMHECMNVDGWVNGWGRSGLD